MHLPKSRVFFAGAALALALSAALLIGGCTALPRVSLTAAPAPVTAAATLPAREDALSAAVVTPALAAATPTQAPEPTAQPAPPASVTRAVSPATVPLESRRAPVRSDATAAATATRPAPASLAGPITQTTKILTQTENILLLGTDTRSSLKVWNTDSIMVLAIDRAAGQVGVISIPRDLWVDIPGYGEDRINQADYLGEQMGYPGGGPALAQRTVELVTGIPTQHYVIFQQDGLIKLVDALGGVTVNLDCPLYEKVPDPKNPDAFLTLQLPAGPVLLNGDTAKKFVTYRYVESDWGRQRRQQQLVWALRNRVLQGDVISRIPQLMQALNGMFTTDLSVTDILGLAAFGARLKPGDMHVANVGPDLYEDTITDLGAWVLLLKDRNAFQEQAAAVFSGRSLNQSGQSSGSGCPTPPPDFPGLPTPTPAPTP